MDAGPHVGGTADDLQGFGRSDINLADAEFVCIWVAVALTHKTHHHPGGLSGQVLDGIHLKTS